MNILSTINPTRHFNMLYIIIDSIFIIFLLILLWVKKQKITFWWSIFGGILYFIVDFGYFYLLSGSRVVSINNQVCNPTSTALVLLWMSLSYGITNFCYIWLFLKKDKDLKEFIILIVGWWLVAPTISSLGGNAVIETFRTTNKYHGVMGIILVAGYLMLILYNLLNKNNYKINILRLNIIGISVQFFWEFALLINGIRPFNDDSIMTLMINSLIETNLGLPYIYLIYCFVSKKYHDDLSIVEEVKA